MKNFHGALSLSKFWNFIDAIQIISCRFQIGDQNEFPLYHNDTKTRNSQWSGGIAAQTSQKIPIAKIHSKICHLDFLLSRYHPPHWLSSNVPNYQRGELVISDDAIDGHLERKKRRVGS